MNPKELPIPAAYLKRLQETPQNPRWHAEGDVLVHTKMVVEKFFELREKFELSEEDEKILYWASVLHDIGKPDVTVLENDRWRSPGHERAGVPHARDILLQQKDLNPRIRRRVLDIVRWHGFPLWWMMGKPRSTALKRLGTRTDLRLLAIFSVFDFHGRIADSLDQTIASIEEFQKLHVPKAEYELGRFDDLQQEFEKWNIPQKNAAWNSIKMGKPELVEKLLEADAPVDNGRFGRRKVYLTIGPPLAGKSHFIEAQFPDAFHVDLEEFLLGADGKASEFHLGRRIVELKHYLEVYLRRHSEVVIEGRNTDAGMRKRLNEMLRKLPAEIHYLIFETPLPTLLGRNRNLNVPLDENLIEQHARRLLFPHPWEAHSIRFIESLD